ncbi:metallophosphoesterase family protein [Halorussus sp. AFM4]|uniref:metallophosphoesterase family protein n=1 Tax=Halorussus sp. AFM4 TaxID=3421651 RepID=UPI003EBA7C81
MGFEHEGSKQRFLVVGDNHGDAESLKTVVEETAGEKFDFVIHTGDITDAYHRGVDTAADQLRSLEPLFETLAERGELVYIYGNRDSERGGDSHVTDRYELSPGTHLPSGDSVKVAGQRFTADPDAVTAGDVLVTHGQFPTPFYKFEGRAYFCGHTHRGWHRGRALNAAHLKNVRKGYLGAYFIVTVDDSSLDVECYGIDEPWKAVECPDHNWVGTQYQPAKFGCRLCKFGEAESLRDVAWAAYTLHVDDPGEEAIDATDLMTQALSLLDGSDQFEEQFRGYINALLEQPGPHDPLQPSDGHPTRLVPRSW